MKKNMSPSIHCFTAWMAALALQISPAQAITFTSNTTINFSDTIYDGSDIIVTNCTLSVNGTHSFASLRVLNGGVVTHPYNQSGLVGDLFSVTDEAYVLNGTNTEALAYPNAVASTVFVTDEFGLTLYFEGTDYVVNSTNGQTTIQRTETSAIPDGDIVLVSYFVQNPPVPTGLNLNVSGDVVVDPGGAINVTGKGYGSGFGSGLGSQSGNPLSGSGAGHGGYGGMSSSNAPGGTVYDSLLQPAGKGSAGGNGIGGAGGAGGGFLKLVVGGTLRDDGNISANGANATNSRSGGGSGGGIWLSAQAIEGTGSISADGGSGEPIHGGGGGGGRIAVYFSTNTFAGNLSAHGGNGFVAGGAGTIYTKSDSQSAGLVLLDNNGRSGTNTPTLLTTLADLTVRGGAVVMVTPLISQPVRNLVIGSNSWLMIALPTPASGPFTLTLTVASNATIQAGGGILMDGIGYPGSQGPGAGFTTNASGSVGTIGSGAGHGGYGGPGSPGPRGGNPYGNLFSPRDFGSGGSSGGFPIASPGGAGGGVIRFTIGGALVLDGKISANGMPSMALNGGGGSGGSIYLTARTLSGSGLISANGGAGNNLGGGGGGGRIALEYQTNLFAGAATTFGGSGGTSSGGAGTIYTARGGAGGQLADAVLVDNGGRLGAATSFGTYSTFTANLTLAGGASLAWPSGSPFTIRNLLITSNAWLLATNSLPITITVLSNATIQAGGTVVANGAGFTAVQGPGGGRTAPNSGGGSGGGYGGSGGTASGGALGGATYGILAQPLDRGSGGGNGYYPNNFGGAGGGALRINVTGALQLDGRVLANGSSGAGTNGGGGSGGSIWISAARLSGAGVASANGGAGGGLGGGGGGGGRIAFTYGTNTFTGAVSAYGGGGFAVGGAGTIFLKANSQPYGLVRVDNGGATGPSSSLGSLAQNQIDLTLTGGAALPFSSTLPIGNLRIGANSRLLLTNPISGTTLQIRSNATIEAGGSIIADGAGSPPGQGIGSGRTGNTLANGGGGGGYGGSGAVGAGGTLGGTPYGTLTQLQLQSGSGGGNGYFPNNPGGAGGGSLGVSVSGALQLDGRISAGGNGGGGTNGGGGSGGGVRITVGRLLSGFGTVSANGGTGAPGGGGGGGGRIAITYGSNTFSGLLTAFGGGGFAVGGAGTIFLEGPLRTPSRVIVDNGGPLGGSTSLGSQPGTGYDYTITQGGVLALPDFLTMRNLLITSNSWLMLVTIETATLTVTSNATVQAGGGISGDGTDGFVQSGQGSGGTSPFPGGISGGGGGYGGFGSASAHGASGGTGFGSATQPISRGGKGGPVLSSPSQGGAGGAPVRLTVNGSLLLDGRLSSNGRDGIAANSGGGAGGSLWLTVGTLTGTGSISANGGRGNSAGSSGGGGRIAVYYSTNSFVGTISAFGGGGTNFGGAGTIYTKANNKNVGQMLVDNGGHQGTNTILTESGVFDLTVQGAAALVPAQSSQFQTLLVASNSWLIVSNQAVLVNGTTTIQRTGGIKADGRGSSGGQGAGAGSNLYSPSLGYTGGGGGHGGYGAASAGGAPGGNTYDVAIESPALPGSGGGGNPSSSAGAGGGVIRLGASVLQLDGLLSANGQAGSQNSGGGSGGSVSLVVGTLGGSGTISVNGGAGGNLGGGGGGGRIAVQYATKLFTGTASAFGGSGWDFGGAGTIYTKDNNKSLGDVVMDNGGELGTNTPFTSAMVDHLTIAGGAVVQPGSSFLRMNRLTVGAGGWLISPQRSSNLDILVYNNAVVEAGGFVTVDGRGFGPTSGPGAGQSVGGFGSGAGHGAEGGASATAPGGPAYGSAQQPIDAGRGGGFGSGPSYPGSEGGGVIRMNVGGKLTVNGWLSADGADGFQDNSGGGSGGSIWVTAAALDGNGFVTADGGFGELYGGGGGAGGRIAIYSLTNLFSGLVSVEGGIGASSGGDGTIHISTNLPALEIISQTPSGVISNSVSGIVITFSTPLNPNTFSGQDYLLTTPTWIIYGTNLVYSSLAADRYQILSGPLAEPGDYTIRVGPDVMDIFGRPMSQVYTGSFTLVLPVIQGRVTDTNGQPVAGVLLDPGPGMSTTLSDVNGHYAVGFTPGASFTVTSSLNGFMFAPGTRSYTNVSTSVSNENYLVITTIAPAVASGRQGNDLFINWHGLPGVTYQLYSSTNFVNWLPYGNPITGSNAVVEIPLPIEADPMKFFKVQASN